MFSITDKVDFWCVVFGGFGDAASTQACDSGSGVCVAFSIPPSTDSGRQDILATVQAPGSLGWVGFGFGQQMTGSLVFVMWPDEDKVVVSPRYASYSPLLPLNLGQSANGNGF